MRALYDAMKAIREGQLPSTLRGVAPKSLIETLTGSEAYAERVRRYLGGR